MRMTNFYRVDLLEAPLYFALAIFLALGGSSISAYSSQSDQSRYKNEDAEGTQMTSDGSIASTELYQLLMTLKPIPPEVAKAKGAAEDAYTKKLIEDGTIRSFFVSENHKNYWITFSVKNESALKETLMGFQLHDYFDYEYVKVMSIIDMVKAGITGPND